MSCCCRWCTKPTPAAAPSSSSVPPPIELVHAACLRPIRSLHSRAPPRAASAEATPLRVPRPFPAVSRPPIDRSPWRRSRGSEGAGLRLLIVHASRCRLLRDWARPTLICNGTWLAPCHICTGTGARPMPTLADCRPEINAAANKAHGGGREDPKDYGNTRLHFAGAHPPASARSPDAAAVRAEPTVVRLCDRLLSVAADIENIHVMKKSLGKLHGLCLNEAEGNDPSWLHKLSETQWLEHVGQVHTDRCLPPAHPTCACCPLALSVALQSSTAWVARMGYRSVRRQHCRAEYCAGCVGGCVGCRWWPRPASAPNL
jgi:hypothetical protein